MSDPRILIVAEDPLARAGLDAILADQPGCTVVGRTGGEDELQSALDVYSPDVLVWDLGWDPAAQIEALSDIQELGIPIVALVSHEADASASRAAGPLRVNLPDGRTLPAVVLANDTGLDLAALSVTATDLLNTELGDSSRLKPGQLVLALGHPWEVIGAVTAGVVIGSGSQWPELPPSKREWVAGALNVRSGNSGGPLTDVHGRLVGMNTVMTSPEVGLAIPVHVVKRFLQQAVRKSRRIF